MKQFKVDRKKRTTKNKDEEDHSKNDENEEVGDQVGEEIVVKETYRKERNLSKSK